MMIYFARGVNVSVNRQPNYRATGYRLVLKRIFRKEKLPSGIFEFPSCRAQPITFSLVETR